MLFLRSAAKCGVVKQGGRGCLELTLITNFYYKILAAAIAYLRKKFASFE